MRLRRPQNLGPFPYDGNVVGGSLIGAGMALTGACPGTALVQSATGVPSGAYVLLGCVLGGLGYVTLQPVSSRVPTVTAADEGKVQDSKDSDSTAVISISVSTAPATLQASLGLSTAATLVAYEAACVLVLAATARYGARTEQKAGLINPLYSGVLIGAAQATKLLLTRRAIGCSGAYEAVGRWLQQLTGRFDKGRGSAAEKLRSLFTPTVVFAVGITAGSALAGCFYEAPKAALVANVSESTAVLGGVAMGFGGLIAGGCTSGHGISGIVTFSLASFVSVAAMFGSGVLTSALL